jgi:hypothetical protein
MSIVFCDPLCKIPELSLWRKLTHSLRKPLVLVAAKVFRLGMHQEMGITFVGNGTKK